MHRLSLPTSGFPVRLAYGLMLLVLILATNRYFSAEQAFQLGFSDTDSYLRIALASDLSTLSSLTGNTPSHHLERWPLHWLIGCVARNLSLEPWLVYRIAAILTASAIVAALASTKASIQAFFVLTGLLLLAPYGLRSFIAAPGMLSDNIFFLSSICLMLGIARGSNLMLGVALTLGLLSRQTFVMFAPICILGGMTGHLPLKRAILIAACILGLFIFLRMATNHLFPGISHNYGAMALGLWDWLQAPDRTTGVDFFGRILFFIALLSPILLLDLPRSKLLFALGGFFLIAVQPVLGGPPATGQNILRLLTLGLPFLIPAVIETKMNKTLVVFFIVLMFINSLHHNYSILPGQSIHIYAGLILTTTILCAICWRKRRFSHH